jgi:hypothetical protein
LLLFVTALPVTADADSAAGNSAAAVQKKTSIGPIAFLLRTKEKNRMFFEPTREYASGTDADYLSSGDLNKDGWVDFAVPSATANIYVHFNNKDGTLTAGVPIAVGAASVQTHIADIDGDGNMDILVVHPGNSGGFSVLKGNGNGTFLAVDTQHLNMGNAQKIVTGDFVPDMNNRLDIALALNTTPVGIATWRLRIMENDGAGTFTPASNFAISVPTGLDTADVDNDGHLDLLTTLIEPSQLLVNMGTGIGPNYFEDSSVIDQTHVHDNPYQGWFVDVNGDGDLDIIVGGAGTIIDGIEPPVASDNVTFIPGAGNGTFDTGAIVTTRTGTYKSRGFVTADFDDDGKLDIASASPGDIHGPPPARPGQTISVFFGDDTGAFDLTTMLEYDGYPHARGIVVEDLDHDGDMDIIFTIGGYNTIGVLRNVSP